MGLCREYALLSDAGPHPYVDQLQRIQCLLQDVGESGFHLILITTTYSTNRVTLIQAHHLVSQAGRNPPKA